MSKQKVSSSIAASSLTSDLKPELTPQERLSLSRSEIVNFMQKDNHIFQIFQPVVTGYAKANPMKTLGIAAGIGAAIVVLKPWRLITIGSLLAVLKSRF
jgi:ElaB/YqjD/DUF883 family membrane-anchored ribosome-binding protein